MQVGIVVTVTPQDRRRLEAVVRNRILAPVYDV